MKKIPVPQRLAAFGSRDPKAGMGVAVMGPLTANTQLRPTDMDVYDPEAWTPLSPKDSALAAHTARFGNPNGNCAPWPAAKNDAVPFRITKGARRG